MSLVNHQLRGAGSVKPGHMGNPSRLQAFFGLAAFCLGAWVLCGWLWHIPLWVQLLPGFAPMQFNTALGIALGGVGVALLERQPRVAAAIGCLVTLLGLTVLVQFVAGVNLGIDQLFFNTWLITDSETPGRMSITTAVYFVIVGLSLASISRRSGTWIRWRMLSGMCLVCVSVVALFGYLLGIESAFRWGETTRMAAHTAVAFALLGAGIVGSWKPLTSQGRRLVVSLSIGFSLAGAAMFVWSGMLAEHRELLRGRLDVAALNNANTFAGAVNYFADTLKHLASRLPDNCGASVEQCQAELDVYFRDHPPLRKLGSLNNEGAVVSFSRPAGGSAIEGPESPAHYGEALLEAGLGRVADPKPQAVLLTSPTAPAALVIGLRKSAASPVLFASLDPGNVLSMVSPALEAGWTRHVWSGAAVINGMKPRENPPGRIVAEHGVVVFGTNWTFAVGADLAEQLHSSFNDLTLLFGLLMAFSVGSAYFLLQISRERARELRINNQMLAEETRRAGAASRSKSEFLAVMSHEIRTPMNAIMGMTELLQESKLTDDQRRYVNLCHRAGSNLLVLINDILDLSKIEADRIQLEQTGFRLSELLNSTVDLVRIKARAKGLPLDIQLLPGTEERLIGDPTRLRQILINLLGNAVKFTESGRITLTVGPAPSGVPAEVKFAVSDTGCGIPADKIEMIFDRFTQADSSATRQYGGTGLGLAICRSLVELMGGRLSVTSTVAKGSTFEFTVPFQPDVSEPLEPQATKDESSCRDQPSAGRPLRILVADDSFDNQLLMREYLKKGQHELTFVNDGQGAIDQFIAGDFDLILMDIQMPVLDGLAATRAIRGIEKDAELPPVPILALTASARREDIDASAQAGCSAHLSKPISQRRLLEAIGRYAPNGNLDPDRRDSEEIRERLKKIAPSYLVQQRQELSRMLESLSESDFEGLWRLGHNLRGTGAVYGFSELTTLGEAIENSAAKEDVEAIRSHLRQMEDYLNRAHLTKT